MLMTLTGPSCAGKTYLLYHIIETYPDIFQPLPSVTTRHPRAGEEPSVEYRFIDQDTFALHLSRNELIQSVCFNGSYYGTLQSDIDDIVSSGKTPIRIVEPGGVTQFHQVARNMSQRLFSVYVYNDLETIMDRLLKRFSDDVLHNKVDESTRLYYGQRIVNCLQEEMSWIDRLPYNYYADLSAIGHKHVAHTLSRVASGNVPMSVANGLSPYPHERMIA